MTSYAMRRAASQRWVCDTLSSHGLLPALRGSWKCGDFHLDRARQVTLSDLDLVVPGASAQDCARWRREVRVALGERLLVPVSVHNIDALPRMSLGHSMLLNVGEFVAKARRLRQHEPAYQYAMAKTVLMLLRRSTDERYGAVALRMQGAAPRRAMQVKLGEAPSMDVVQAASMLHGHALPLVKKLAALFVRGGDVSELMVEITEQLRLCDSIDVWLQDYLIRKMHNDALA